MRMESPDFHHFVFQLEVRDLPQLNDVLNSLKLTAGLSEVRRGTASEAKSVITGDWSSHINRKETA
jgi:guanosine-3',5'-bis(diphosphate) 3'-pyrophosphohydrolase